MNKANKLLLVIGMTVILSSCGQFREDLNYLLEDGLSIENNMSQYILTAPNKYFEMYADVYGNDSYLNSDGSLNMAEIEKSVMFEDATEIKLLEGSTVSGKLTKSDYELLLTVYSNLLENKAEAINENGESLPVIEQMDINESFDTINIYLVAGTDTFYDEIYLSVILNDVFFRAYEYYLVSEANPQSESKSPVVNVYDVDGRFVDQLSYENFYNYIVFNPKFIEKFDARFDLDYFYSLLEPITENETDNNNNMVKITKGRSIEMAEYFYGEFVNEASHIEDDFSDVDKIKYDKDLKIVEIYLSDEIYDDYYDAPLSIPCIMYREFKGETSEVLLKYFDSTENKHLYTKVIKY